MHIHLRANESSLETHLILSSNEFKFDPLLSLPFAYDAFNDVHSFAVGLKIFSHIRLFLLRSSSATREVCVFNS